MRSLSEARGSRSDAGGFSGTLCIPELRMYCVLVRIGAYWCFVGFFFWLVTFLFQGIVMIFIAVLSVIEAVAFLRRF